MFLNASDEAFPSVDPELDSCSNYTAAWLWLTSLQPSFLALTSVVGLLGNGMVLVVFCLQRKTCTVADIYLGNLAAADLVMMCCLPFWAFTITQGYQWDFGEALCKVVNAAIAMNYICSVMFLTLVSLDRYLALVKPMSSSRLRRPTWAKRICLIIWILGFIYTLPTLIFRAVVYVEDPGVNAWILAYPHPIWRVHHNISMNVIGFLIPVLVVSVCSYYIVTVLREGQASRQTAGRSERKATNLVLAVMAVFLICWTPHQVMRFLDTLEYFDLTPGCLWGHVLDIGIQLSTYLAYSNSAINPFLFVIVGKHFRRRSLEVLGKIRSGSKDMTNQTVSFTSANRINDRHRVSVVNLEKHALFPKSLQ
ncbi:B2 bradykinin receptor [Synchiropus splendidus]|uniref:B2 bradykinin receptor n=1 Tax=Synchiropus splendidus TaxID=270530 RepID=UPI00237DCFDF|nr:B2 bradykinin receptor [Synchiropus splendidus]